MLLSLAGNALGTVPLAVLSHADFECPSGIVQCAAADGEVVVMVACQGVGGRSTRLMKISSRSGVLDSVDNPGTDDGPGWWPRRPGHRGLSLPSVHLAGTAHGLD